MRIPGIPTAKSDHRKGGSSGSGRNGSNSDTSGGSGGKLNSGRSNSSSGYKLRIFNADSPTEGHDRALVHAGGGEISAEVDSEYLEAPSDDDKTANQVHRINHRVRGYSDLNNTLPGVEVAKVIITLNAYDIASLCFISDEYSAIEAQGATQESCSGVTVSDLIPSNSTNGLRVGNETQAIRGDSITALLWGYDKARGFSGSPNPILNPQPPPSMNVNALERFNFTFGGLVLLMNVTPGLNSSTSVLEDSYVSSFLWMIF